MCGFYGVVYGAFLNFLNAPVIFPMVCKTGNAIRLTGVGISMMSNSDLYLRNRKTLSIIAGRWFLLAFADLNISVIKYSKLYIGQMRPVPFKGISPAFQNLCAMPASNNTVSPAL